MDTQPLQMLVGFICSAVFAAGKVPTVLKAVRTQDLHSYSLLHIGLSAGGNLLYWVYVVGLPVGPVWFLQAFFTAADVIMLALCLSQRGRPPRAEAV